MPLTIRAPTIDELSDLSDLCFRSKAVWGYDEEFMDACRGELSFEPRDLELTPIAVAEHDGKPIGVAQVKVVDDEADLLKLFVEPSALRSGTGKGAARLGYRRREKTRCHATNNRGGSRCGSLLPQDGSLRCRPSALWLGAGKDVAEISDEPLPCGLIFRSETGSFATCRRVRDVVVIGGADVVVFLRLCSLSSCHFRQSCMSFVR